MAQVISATTRFARGGGKRAEFLAKARFLLDQSREHYRAGEVDLALEYAYQSALRTAGARIAGSPVAQRKRRPTNAWDQLKLVDETGVAQAQVFEHYSRFRSRVSSGIERDPDRAAVAALMEKAAAFLAEVELDIGGDFAAA
ncbi:SAV_6107 family HEPN domain-containing protein [Corynebacterium halotolerans]|uniref:SAV_6107 family HEPN domain-containing protein n=1 Tax=Corynebacterium halotolerans TaxID=225326 RepID=UPI003CEF0170